MERKVVICCPARNEAGNLKRVLPAWSACADHIIIADQSSSDDTKSIVASFDKAIIINNPDTDYNETNRIKLLVDKARGISNDSVLLFLDADEILSGNILHSPEWKTFCQSPPGTAGAFQWIQLWKSPWQYINSGYGAPSHNNFAFIDDARPLGKTSTIHGHRGVGLDDPKTIFIFNDVVLLHLAFMNFRRNIKKQNWYKTWWITRGGKYFYTNRNHNWYHFVTQNNLAISREDWFLPYLNLGLDVTSVEINPLEWYDIEILRYFDKFGYEKFHLLDIWDEEDWEFLRLKAISEGYDGIPSTPVKFPNRVTRLYTRWVNNRISIGEIFNKLIRFGKRVILP